MVRPFGISKDVGCGHPSAVPLPGCERHSLHFQNWHCASFSWQGHRRRSRRLPKKKPECMFNTAPTRKGKKGLLFIPSLRPVF